MNYQEKFFFICKIALSAADEKDVEVISRTTTNENFPEIFKEYEELKSHAFNEDGLYSVIRADEIFVLIRTNTEKSAKNLAYAEATSQIITNLQHRVMQKNDDEARAILKEVHDIEL